jgi:hypothetical protein
MLRARAGDRGAGVRLFVSRVMAEPYNVLFLCTGTIAPLSDDPIVKLPAVAT